MVMLDPVQAGDRCDHQRGFWVTGACVSVCLFGFEGLK